MTDPLFEKIEQKMAEVERITLVVRMLFFLETNEETIEKDAFHSFFSNT